MTAGAQALDEPIRSRRNHRNNQIASHAQMRQDAVAVRFRGVDTTWRQLHERSLKFADALARRGIGYKHPKDLVIVAELPRNASGKVVKVQLRKDYSS